MLLISLFRLISIFFTGGSGYLQASNLKSGRDPTFASVKDFGAKGDLRTCTDPRITKGSTTLFSARCNFSPADVNKWVQVPLAGDSFGTGLSAQIVSVQDPQHTTLSVAAGATVTAAVRSYTDIATSNYTGLNQSQVSSALTPFTPDEVGLPLTITGGTGFTLTTVTVLKVDFAGVAVLSGSVGAINLTGGTGTVPIPTTIASGDYDAIRSAATYACGLPHTMLLFPAGNYYLEQYKTTGGAGSGITDVTWANCRDVTVTGYGAVITANGAFRRTNDTAGNSYSNTVSPFYINGATNMKVLGFELDGSNIYTTKAVGVAEGWDYGIHEGASQDVTFRDINTHNWQTDGIDIGHGSFASHRISLDNVWTHNNGRQGMTIEMVNGVIARDFDCSQIGDAFTLGYGGHSPRDCVDIEPPIAVDLPTGDIVFSGGYQASARGTLFVAPGARDLTVENVVFDCTMSQGCGGVAVVNFGARRALIKNNTFYMKRGTAFACNHTFNPNLERLDITGNRFIMTAVAEIACNSNDGSIRPIHFIGNHVYVSGTEVTNGAILLDHLQEVRGNDFFLSKNAKLLRTVNVINYTSTETVADNIYSTDLTNAADPYAVDYTNVRLYRNEKSLNPADFVVKPNGGGNMTFAGNLSIAAPSAPAALSVTCIGTCTGASNSYKVVGVVGSGATAASAAGTVAAGPGIFSRINYNTVKWDYVPGVETYDIYCTSGCSTTGKLNAQPISMNYYADTVGVGDGSAIPVSTTGLGTVKVDSGIQLVGATQPACDAARRGTFWYLAGGTGVKDTVSVCAKDAADSYHWRVIY